MIAEILKNDNLLSATTYNQNKVIEGVAEIVHTKNTSITEESTPNEVHNKLTEFLPFYYRTDPKNLTFHVALNPDPKDVIDDYTMRDIADYYMRAMGYGRQPYVMYKHKDIDRIHYHILSVRVNEEGKKIKDNHERRLSQRLSNKIEEKWNLVRKPTNQKQKISEEKSLEIKPITEQEQNIKSKIEHIAKHCIQTYSFSRLGELNALLEKYNISAASIDKDNKKGLVYAIIGDIDNKTYREPIKASDMSKECSLSSIEERITKSQYKIKRNKGNVRDRIKKSLEVKPKTLTEFKEELRKNRIELVLRTNEEGKVYGITFIDEDNKIILNGSNIDRGYTYNNIQKIIDKNKEDDISLSANSSTGREEEKTKQETREQTTEQNLSNEEINTQQDEIGQLEQEQEPVYEEVEEWEEKSLSDLADIAQGIGSFFDDVDLSEIEQSQREEEQERRRIKKIRKAMNDTGKVFVKRRIKRRIR